ncbi:putative transcriptional regulator LuxR family [Xenorhabdus poinarii G6]|uniref:Putative transcriptional regulator LuxR family n=1 Tax=Xenorhabdus poinarii G6 TaxID=1354304 RepID=A0A068R1T4_9GAMM|nr:LuxR family transcriptional regulator [Xenorhabdus poinarii]CDG21138.1 putative transcriptional regulator LuxR family [Xenorhabdus poinarii G6]
MESKSHNIIKLIEKIIDPAIAEYLATLPKTYLIYSPISKENLTYSELIKLKGFHFTTDQIHIHLRNFINHCSYTEQDILFISTQDMLKELFSLCEGKRPKRSKLAPDIDLNTERKMRLCAFCGNPTEFSIFVRTWKKYGTIEDDEYEDYEKKGKKKRPDLSHTYCLNHRPKLHDGSWNAMYKQAMRSKEQFEQELLRLRCQIAHPDRYNAKSGDKLIDEYFYHYMFDSSLDPTNVAELRDLARRMVDSRLTDNKKRMLVLRRQGLSNQQVGIKLGEITNKPSSNQAVSKAILSVREEFHLFE